MPYPEDPLALTLKTVLACPTCSARPLIRETKDLQSVYMAQARCESCGFVGDYESIRAAQVKLKGKS